MDPIILSIFYLTILVFSVVIHEIAHGAVANWLGDPTAKYAGRLTLNPLKHIDLFGSIIIPFFLYLTTGFAFGYAKPVPVNPFNFRDQKYGQAKVAVAGAAANFALAIVFGQIIRFWPVISNPVAASFYGLSQIIIITNLALAVFNLIPIPPLDGSHILFTFLPPSQEDFKLFLQRYGFIFLLIFIFYLSNYLNPIIIFLYRLITGAPFIIG